MKIAILDSKTMGEDVDYGSIGKCGTLVLYPTTAENEIALRIADAEVVVINKVRLSSAALAGAEKLRLICVFATGYDNVDLDYCKAHGIAVCNVCGYSTDSVAQLTLTMGLSLLQHIGEFCRYVRDDEYSKSGMPNRVYPYFNEIKGRTWGIIGYGNIGREVARLAKAFGCSVIITPHTKRDGAEFAELDELLQKSDIISVHVPLTPETNKLIGKSELDKMKDGAIFINVSRGRVADEAALAEAVRNGKLGGLGIDVYSTEPLAEDNPLHDVMNYENVMLTPHMAWGAYEARKRCIEETAKNIEAFCCGEIRNRVDL